LRDRKTRDELGLFVIEGFRELSRFSKQDQVTPHLEHPIHLRELYISPDCFLGKNEWALINSLSNKVFELPRSLFEKVSYRDRPDGLLGLAEIPTPKPLSSLPWDRWEFILVIEGVEKPGNLGTILRTAEGAGVDAVLVGDPKTDLYNPNVVRSSTGVLFTIPVLASTTEEIIQYTKSSGYKVFSVTPEANKLIWDQNLKGKIVCLLGSEQYGLSSFAKSQSDQLVSLPMRGKADSLNLSACTSIVVYECLRQRMGEK
jgi:TrmH family RNA methyltransferase